MRTKLKFKLLIDASLTISLLFLMSYSLVGEKAHEIIGILMFMLFIVHLIFNRKYLKNINKFKNLKGYFQNSLIFLMLVCFIGSMISGIIESRYLFTSLNTKSSYLMNRIHMLSAYWGFVFMSMHLGCHFMMIKAMFNKNKVSLNNLFIKILNIIILLYGVYAFFKMDILNYLFLNDYFFILDDDVSLFLYLLNFMSIMYSIAYITMLIKHNLLSLSFMKKKN